MATPTPNCCSRYPSCSANICPLDQDWIKRNHTEVDRVCHLLIKAGKNESLNEAPEVIQAAKKQASAIWEHLPRIRNKCLKK